MKAIEALKEFLANETDDYCYEFGFNNEETLKVEILGQTHTLSAALVDAEGNLLIYLERGKKQIELENNEEMAAKVCQHINNLTGAQTIKF